jgi:hypothetical protein
MAGLRGVAALAVSAAADVHRMRVAAGPPRPVSCAATRRRAPRRRGGRRDAVRPGAALGDDPPLVGEQRAFRSAPPPVLAGRRPGGARGGQGPAWVASMAACAGDPLASRGSARCRRASVGTTRWHGTRSATRLLATADATARTARGAPMAAATSAYERVSPAGMARTRARPGPGTVSRARPSAPPPSAPPREHVRRAPRSGGPARGRDGRREPRPEVGVGGQRGAGDTRPRGVRVLRGQRRLEGGVVVPSVTAHTPRGVAATSTRPTAVAAVAYRKGTPRPPRR